MKVMIGMFAKWFLCRFQANKKAHGVFFAVGLGLALS